MHKLYQYSPARWSSFCFLTVAGLMCSFLESGCAQSTDLPPMGLVSGNVILNGKPAAQALVMFQPAKGPASAGETDSTGKFTLTTTSGSAAGAVVGTHRVTITTGIETPPPGANDRQVDKLQDIKEHAWPEPVIVSAGKNELMFEIPVKPASKK